MVQVPRLETFGGCGAERRPGTRQEAVRQAGQEASGRRVRRKLLPPARRPPRCGPGRGAWQVERQPVGSATRAQRAAPGVVTPPTVPAWEDAQDL